MSENDNGNKKNSLQAMLPFALIVSLFFMWGIASSLNDILIKHFKKSFELTDFQSGFIQTAFYMGYFLLAMPAAHIMRRYGYKVGIIMGLILFSIGAFLFYPAADAREYGFFLTALFVIASGCSFLETAANPYVTILGPPESSERRLNFAQAFNPLGTIFAVIIGRNFIFSGIEYTNEQLTAMTPEHLQNYLATETRSVQMPYVIIGAVVLFWAFLFLITKFPDVKESSMDEEGTHDGGSLKHLLHYRHFVLGVIAQFFYVGAQVCTWSYLIRYAQYSIPGTPEKTAADYLTITLVGFLIGRFLGTWLMNRVKPQNLMAIFAVANVILSFMGIIGPGYVGLVPLIISSFFMSVMFPTIFALGIKGLGVHTKLGSSLMVMSIIGGAVLTPLMGLISVYVNIKIAFTIVVVAYAFIVYYSVDGYKIKPAKVQANQ
jgi:MFS transporter, FHS family, L-fucose permease